MKKAICLFLCLLIAGSFSGCGGLLLAGIAMLDDDRASKEDIAAYVTENEDLLLQCIDANNFQAVESAEIIMDISPKDGFVEFSCGGYGFGSATAYCGFYYSAKDDMTEIWCAPTYGTLTESGSGYEWHGDGDNTYYTENICGHFYYYEASF